MITMESGGRGGIRTHEGLAPLAVFKSDFGTKRQAFDPDEILVARLGKPRGIVESSLILAVVSGNWHPYMPPNDTDESLTRNFWTSMPKLTSDLIQSASAPKRGSITLWDVDHRDAIRGFGLRIFAPTKRHPGGGRSFFVNYRVDGFERRHTIGPYPTWSTAAARAEAKELRRRIDAGEDPASEKAERRDAATVQDLIDRYVEEHLPTKAQGRRALDERRMLAEIGKSLGADRKVADIHYGDMQHLHKTITASGRPVRANRVLAVASKMFSLSLLPRAGEAKPWREASMGNPCRGVERNQEHGRERFFSEAELGAIGDALEAYADGQSPTADAIRLTMLTGCRPSEALLATWEQFDSEPGYWVKPAATIKQRKTHKLPLSPAAIELIERVRRQRGEFRAKDWLFPGLKSGEPVKDPWDCWGQVRERATVHLWGSSEDAPTAKLVADLRKRLKREPGVNECQIEAERRDIALPTGLLDARIYDLRHSFASIGAAGGLSLYVLGKLLGHTVSRTTERYAHLGDAPLREAATRIASTIARAGKTGAKVVRGDFS
jgi:integrase